jgi:hypothetical protein
LPVARRFSRIKLHSVQYRLTLICAQSARQYFQERRLSRPILAQQRVNFRGSDLEFDTVQSFHPRKLFVDVASIQYKCGGHQAATELRQCARLDGCWIV